MKNNLIKKFMEFSIGNWVGLIISLVLTPITTRLIDPQNFGLSAIIITTSNMLMVIIGLGTDQSFIRFYNECNEQEEKIGLLRNCLKLPIIIYLFMFFISLVFYKPISKIAVGEENFYLLIIMYIYLLILLIGRYATLILRMKQRGKAFSINQIMIKVVNFIFILILFQFIYGNDYRTVLYAEILSNIAPLIYSVWLEKDYWNFKTKSINKFNQKVLVNYGIPLGISVVITWIFQSTDRYVIKYFLGDMEVGYYTVAFKLVVIFNIIQTTFSNFWVPVSYEEYSKKDVNKKFFQKMHILIAVGMFLMLFLIITFKDLIILFLGNKYIKSTDIFEFLIFIPIFYTISEVTVVGINFKKKPKYHIYISVIVCLLNLILNFAFVPKFGGNGAALATSISYLVFYELRTIISQKCFNVEYKKNSIRMLYIYSYLFIIVQLYLKLNLFQNIIFLILGVVLLLTILKNNNIEIFSYKNSTCK